MMTTAWPTASSSRIDGLSRKLRQPSELNRKPLFFAVATTTTATSTRKIDSSRERSDGVSARRVGESPLGSTSSASLVGHLGGVGAVVTRVRALDVGVAHRAVLQVVGGGVHDGLGGGVGAVEVGGDPALADDEDAVGHAEDLGELGGDHQDREALPGELGEQPVHLGLGADVDAAGGLVDDQQLGIGGQPLGDDDLLLVAAAHRGRGHVERAGLHLQAARPRGRRPGSPWRRSAGRPWRGRGGSRRRRCG